MLTSATNELLKDLLQTVATSATGIRENRFRADHPDDQTKIDELINAARIQRKDGYLTLRPLAIAELATVEPAAADLQAQCARLFDAIYQAVRENPDGSFGLVDLGSQLQMTRSELINVLKYLLDTGIFSTWTDDLGAEGANVTPNVSFLLRHKTYGDLIEHLRGSVGITPTAMGAIAGTAALIESTDKVDAQTAARTIEGNTLREPQRIGGRQNTSREAGEQELCLNVEDYAAVIASLFSGADRKEFCLALYGLWGRGKSFLMRRVAKVLEGPATKYKTVHFSAWKYPSSPEVWVHLYEEFADAALRGPWVRTWPIAVRTGIAKHGPGRLLIGLALLAIGIFPVAHLLQWTADAIAYLYPVIGVMGFIWIWTFVRGVRKTNARLSDTYLSATRHTEKLGLQATIGTDLAALLKGWMPANGLGTAFTATYWIIGLVLIVGTWLRLQSGKHLEAFASDELSASVVIAAAPWLSILVTVLVVLLCAAAIHMLRFGGSPPSRVLLVVDDLDRCKPEHLLSVMESIKLLIEDEEISRRVQVAMLLEEDILRHAIFVKYGALSKDDMHSILRTPYDIERLMRENCEKLFTAHLRLPSLGATEVRDLIESFSGRRTRMQRQRKDAEERRDALQREMNRLPDLHVQSGKETVPRPSRIIRGEIEYSQKEAPIYQQANDAESNDIIKKHERRRLELGPMLDKLEAELSTLNAYAPEASQPQRGASSVDEAQVLDDSEIDAIIDALVTQKGLSATWIGPRTVRAFLFRYQLARLLLERLGIHWTAATLARELAAQYGVSSSTAPEKVKPVTAELSDWEKLKRIVDQVS